MEKRTFFLTIYVPIMDLRATQVCFSVSLRIGNETKVFSFAHELLY